MEKYPQALIALVVVLVVHGSSSCGSGAISSGSASSKW